ncbi:MAG TPA: DNA topoisomerase IV subunit A [Pseudolabrys sp.]|nr:DNA topoisomerase IV subunit A [Pseudolabrys sp.]
MGPRLIPPDSGDIEEVALREALEERYLAYALSTIMNRALPDARDGLKPVHRRILYGMRLLRLDPGAAFKKSAKVVGDVMGNFHPHGDQAIYDALVRLAQDFAQRYPLIDGQGNFGNVDGDNPAAMRYTESRLTEVARLLIDGIDEDAVDFRPTYDGAGEEPVVLPAAFPNLLANGAQGIAVGMATAIPPHNAAELCDAALHLIETPNARSRTLLKYVKGPDFPTGGIIVDSTETIAEAYATGRGSFRVRACWETEDTGRGTYVVVVTEIPWLVQKSRLVERIADLINEKKLPLVADVRDESAEDIRLVIEPRARTVDAAVMMESLFRLTDLESRIPLNMNVLVKGGRIPMVLGLAEALREWLDHRRDVLVRRSRFRLGKIEHRLEMLGGFLIAYLNLDKVIRIIRNEDEPKPVLIKTFKLTDIQADAILNMRLRNLRKLEEMEIRAEDKSLRKERTELKALIGSTDEQWKTVASEIRELKETFGPKTELGRRRTTFADAPEHDIAAIEQAMVVREPITVVVSEKGWIRALRGHVTDLSGIGFKAGDSLKFAFPTESTGKVLIFGSNGRFYTLDAAKLPGGRGHGEPVRLFIDLEEADVVAALAYQGGRKFLVASYRGNGFIVPEDEVLGTTRKGKQVLNLKASDVAAALTTVEGDLVAAVGENRKLLIFPLDQVPEMTKGRGVRLQRYIDKGLSDIATFGVEAGLTWIDSAGRASVRTIKELKDWRGNRADAGRVRPERFLTNGKFRAVPITGKDNGTKE